MRWLLLLIAAILVAGLLHRPEPLTPCERANAEYGFEYADCERQREVDEAAARRASRSSPGDSSGDTAPEGRPTRQQESASGTP